MFCGLKAQSVLLTAFTPCKWDEPSYYVELHRFGWNDLYCFSGACVCVCACSCVCVCVCKVTVFTLHETDEIIVRSGSLRLSFSLT